MRYLLFLGILLVPCALLVMAQEKSIDPISLDPKVGHGILNNGLSYYIFPQDGKTIQLSLVVKVGTYHGESAERGAPHLIEHLALRSTENFPGGLTKFLMSRGLFLGSNITAKTDPIKTSYEINIPKGDTSLVNDCLLALHDCAKGRVYLPNEVEDERAAVLNEFAIADARRMQEKYFLLDKNPLYDYGAILSEELYSYKEMSIDLLRRFDTQWYRPDLQAVIVVGNIDQDDIEKRVKAIFSNLKNEHDRQPSSDFYSKYDVPLTGRNKLVVMKEWSARPDIRIEMLQKRKSITGIFGPENISQLKVGLTDDLYNELVRQRLNQLKFGNEKAIKNLEHLVDRRAISQLAGIDALTTRIKIDRLSDIKSAIGAAMLEIHRIEKWGFSKSEFILAKESVLKNLNDRFNKIFSQNIEQAIADHFIVGTAFSEGTLELNIRLLNDITLDDVNKNASNWIREDGNTDILLSVPDEHHPDLPSKKEIFSWIQNTMHHPVVPFKQTASILKSLPAPPEKVGISYTRSELPENGATQLMLSNGVKVVIKQLGSKIENPSPGSGDIYLDGFRPGGTNIYKENDFASATIAADLIRSSGISSINQPDLNNWLRLKKKNGELFVNPYILEEEEGITGIASSSNIDDLFNLTYLYFIKPGKDKAVFDAKYNMNGKRTARNKSKGEIFEDSIQRIVSQHVVRKATGPVNFTRAFQIYKNKFSNAFGFTFVITGYFEIDDIIKKATKYLGALPSNANIPVLQNSKADITEHSQPSTNRDLRVTMVDDSTGQADVRMLFAGNVDRTVRNELLVMLAGRMLYPILHARLREQEKGIYDATTSGAFTDHKNKFFIGISFLTYPQNIDRLANAVVEELDKIAMGDLDDDFFASTCGEIHASILNETKRIPYVQECILDQLRKGHLSADGLQREKILSHITKQDVINLIRDCLNRKHYMLFKLL
jgi:zinc protease